MQQLALQFRRFITENFFFDGCSNSFSDDDSLLEAGIIDSTGILELIGFIENSWGIKVEDSDLVPENLDSIRNLVQFVDRKQKLQRAAQRAGISLTAAHCAAGREGV